MPALVFCSTFLARTTAFVVRHTVFTIFHGEDQVCRLTEHALFCIAEHPLGALVPAGDARFRIHRDDRVILGALRCQPHALFAGA